MLGFRLGHRTPIVYKSRFVDIKEMMSPYKRSPWRPFESWTIKESVVAANETLQG